MDFADGAAHVAALLRRDHDFFSVESTASDDDTVVEGARNVELRQVRAHDAFARTEDFVESCRDRAGRRHAGARSPRKSVSSAQTCGRGTHAASPSNSSTAWSRRRLTTAGVAPVSLIVTSTSARGCRAEKSASTARHVSPNPTRRCRRRHACRRRDPFLDQHFEIARRDDSRKGVLGRSRYLLALELELQLFHVRSSFECLRGVTSS